MTRLSASQTATITEMRRQTHEVLGRAHGQPVAVTRNSKLVAYLVPAEAVEEQERPAAMRLEQVLAFVRESQRTAS